MAKYPLQALLTAREFREEAAKREVRKAMYALEEAREKARVAAEELERYRAWRPGEEERLFEEIRGKVMPLTGVDGHREDIQGLRHREFALEEERMQADRAVADAEAAVEMARAAQLEAIRARSKIEEHRDRWRREEQKRLEAIEEAELEEFTGREEDDGEDGWLADVDL